MSKFRVMVGFTAELKIEASCSDEAKQKASDMLDARSVYEDDKLDEMLGEAYYAGGTGDDPPLRNKRASSLRDKDFTADDPVVLEDD